MGQAAPQSLYDLLDDSQRKGLNAIKRRIESSGRELLDSTTGDRVIEILESWLMDDEQKQYLEANTWDIFFLYAAAGLLNLNDADGANNSGGNCCPGKYIRNCPVPGTG